MLKISLEFGVYLGGRPMNESLVLIHAVNHECSTSTNVVDTVIRQLLDTSGLNNNVESIRIVILELLPLGTRVLTIKLDILIACVELLGNIHFYTLVCGDHNA